MNVRRRRRAVLTVLAAIPLVLLAACSGVAGAVPDVRPGLSPALAAPTSPPATGSPRPVSPRPVSPRPVFTWRVVRANARALGRSWHAGCPVGPASLRVAHLSYWGFDGEPHVGAVVVNRSVAARLRPVFETMFQTRFPLRSVRGVQEFGASDDRSMAADNTSAFNCRAAVADGPSSWSEHAYGTAIDVDPVENPYLFQGKVLPPAGSRYTSRSQARPGLIRRGDDVHRAFLAAGFHWGGEWSAPDYQHFER